MVMQCNDNSHESWMAPIDKYEVSEEKKMVQIKSPTGVTHAGSNKQVDILIYWSMNYTI